MERYDITKPISFKVGIYSLNKEPHLNYELCRMINWSNGDLDEVKAIAHNIRNFQDWKLELIALGDKAMAEGRTEQAIAYYRMAEFYMEWDDPDALNYYQLAKELFYDYFGDYFEARDGRRPIVERFEVPYEDTTLPVMRAFAMEEEKGVILLHGGYDSYMEEFLFPMLYFARHGYTVYLFEGPGQGVMLRERGKCVTHRWELPVGAILGYFDLTNVTIIGISLGGYYAPRAAAMDSRIAKVVEWSAFPSFFDNVRVQMGEGGVRLLRYLARSGKGEKLLEKMRKDAKKGNMKAAVFVDAAHKLGASSFLELYKKASRLTIRPFAWKITQDVLILHGDHDVLCSKKLVPIARNLQENARSMSVRILTSRYDQAGDHCNCGNTRLALDTIIDWLEDPAQ